MATLQGRSSQEVGRPTVFHHASGKGRGKILSHLKFPSVVALGEADWVELEVRTVGLLISNSFTVKVRVKLVTVT